MRLHSLRRNSSSSFYSSSSSSSFSSSTQISLLLVLPVWPGLMMPLTHPVMLPPQAWVRNRENGKTDFESQFHFPSYASKILKYAGISAGIVESRQHIVITQLFDSDLMTSDPGGKPISFFSQCQWNQNGKNISLYACSNHIQLPSFPELFSLDIPQHLSGHIIMSLVHVYDRIGCFFCCNLSFLAERYHSGHLTRPT
jgi:hypothetical protein